METRREMEERLEQAKQMPKLGWQDQVTYWLLMILTGGCGFGGIFIALILQDKIAFSDHRVVASTIGNGTWNYLPIVIWGVVVFLMLIDAYTARTPIFGRKDIEYGVPNYPDVYPLLMRDKPVSAEGEMRKKQTKIQIAMIAFLICAPLFFLSLYGRSLMLNDGSIETYDAINSPEYQCSADEIHSVWLNTYISGGKSRSWHAEMVIVTPDLEEYRFAAHSFRGDDVEQLQMMIKMKERYSDRCTIEGVENVWRVARSQYSSDPEARELLYELFEVDLEVSE